MEEKIINIVFNLFAVCIGGGITYLVSFKLNRKEHKRALLDHILNVLIEIDYDKHKAYPGPSPSAEKITNKLINDNKIKLTRIRCDIYGLKNTSKAIENFTNTYIGEGDGYNHIEEAINQDLKEHKL